MAKRATKASAPATKSEAAIVDEAVQAQPDITMPEIPAGPAPFEPRTVRADELLAGDDVDVKGNAAIVGDAELDEAIGSVLGATPEKIVPAESDENPEDGVRLIIKLRQRVDVINVLVPAETQVLLADRVLPA